MKTKQALIIDCDGVLYPSSQISTADFVSAMKNTFLEDVVNDESLYKKIGLETRQKVHFGMFNFIRSICNETSYKFNAFIGGMLDRIDYHGVSPNLELFGLLNKAQKNCDIFILTNNHLKHLDRICQRVFHKSVSDLERHGIRCYDITSTEKNQIFYPKQTPGALQSFAHKIDYEAHECIIIDDSLRNIEMAESIGMKGVNINQNLSLTAYLNQLISTPTNHETGLECIKHKTSPSR